MPTKIILYQCDICKLKYYDDDAEIDAHQCEARGPGKTYPIGCIYGNHGEDAMYNGITFAVARNKIEGHANWGSNWACRDTGYGDSLGENKCGGSSLWMTKSECNVNPHTPHFKRMIKYLRDNMIDITVWDGMKPVYYATFYKLYDKGEWNGRIFVSK